MRPNNNNNFHKFLDKWGSLDHPTKEGTSVIARFVPCGCDN